VLKIGKEIWEKMMEHLRSGWPEEACGILGGTDSLATEVYPIKNVDENPRVRYLIEPQGQFAAFKDMRKKGLEMVAIFHSHPESPAYPSVTDVGLAYYQEAYYIIVSLKDREKPDAHAFKIIDNKIVEYPIVIE
jgi:proteasome lid subunit RPN8/RPN11